jgi:hypothetical protein
MPTFEGCGPYRRWTKPGIDCMPDETRALIEDVMKEQEFVGVLGFSQGAKLTAGLLLEQQMNEKSHEQENGDAAKRPRLNFGVICMGVNPPLTSLPLGLVGAEIITIPTIHLIGQGDPWIDTGKKLFNEHFDHDQSKLFQFDVGHRLPTEEADTATIINEIRRLHRETSGGKQVDLGEVVE